MRVFDAALRVDEGLVRGNFRNDLGWAYHTCDGNPMNHDTACAGGSQQTHQQVAAFTFDGSASSEAELYTAYDDQGLSHLGTACVSSKSKARNANAVLWPKKSRGVFVGSF